MAEETSAEDRVSVARWLAAAVADADRRGLPELRPLLEGLAQATITLRSADWNEGAREEGGGREGGKAAGGQTGRREGGKAEDGRPEGAR